MGATARLSDPGVRVDTGGEATTQVTVRNTGSVVDEFTFTVVGDPAAWTTVEPPSLSLFPDAEGTATIRFRPPRDASTPYGQLPFAVRVISKEDQQGSAIEEGTLDVAPFANCSAEIVPRTTHGRRSGWHEVAIDNRGNLAVEVTLTGNDPDEVIAFRFAPPTLTAAPGTASFSRVRVAARGLLWRGTPATIPFNVTVTPQGQPPIRLDASFQQEPMIPAWLPRTAAVVFALILASAVAWKVVLQPSVRRTVEHAPALQQANANIEKVAKQTGVDLQSPAPVATPSPGASPAGGADAAASAAAAEAVSGQPVTVPVNLRAAANVVSTASLVFPGRSKAAFSVTGVILQNPFNDTGLVSVERHLAGDPPGAADALLRQSLFNQPGPSVSLTPPLVLAPGDTVLLRLQCVQPGSLPAAQPGQQNEQCDVGVLVTGFVRGATAAPSPSPGP